MDCTFVDDLSKVLIYYRLNLLDKSGIIRFVVSEKESIRMMNNKWREFEELTEKCYLSMAGIEDDRECWNQAFGVLKEIVADVRKTQSVDKIDLCRLEEITDYQYDLQAWVEDFLDEIDMREESDKTLAVCDELLNMFRWEKDNLAEIKFLKASAMGAMGKKQEAVEFCVQWLTEEPDQMSAITANVYAYMGIHNMEAAEKLIRQHIPEGTECTDENNILFTAASQYYQLSGNKKEKQRIDRIIKVYEKYLEDYYMGIDEDDEELMWEEEDLPFL